jgi:beta-lactamase class A
VRRRAAVCSLIVALVLAAGLAVAAAQASRPTKHHTTTTPKPIACGQLNSRGEGSSHVAPALDPFTLGSTQAYLRSRGGSITAAVEDLRTGQMFVYNPTVRHVTASIIKLDILETLLRQGQLRGVAYDGADPGVIEGMIEESDNDDATDLWDHVGGPGAVQSYDSTIGMTQTLANVAWGLTTTSAADQIRLLCQLVVPQSPLSPGARDYALWLMGHVIEGQNWGVSGGVPPGTAISLKNGWLPWGGGWEINSVGRIKGDGRWYLLAVLTADNPGMTYGVDTISGLSGLVWNGLAPVEPKPKPRHKHREHRKRSRLTT